LSSNCGVGLRARISTRNNQISNLPDHSMSLESALTLEQNNVTAPHLAGFHRFDLQQISIANRRQHTSPAGTKAKAESAGNQVVAQPFENARLQPFTNHGMQAP